MGSSFRLKRALFVLDGVVLFDAQSPSGESLGPEIPVSVPALPPGDHVLQTLVLFHGEGEGELSCLRGYRFEAKSSHSFTVEQGQAFVVAVVAWEKGDNRTPIHMRPAIRYVHVPIGAP
jgi:hypothetical protein